jgi:hypothetical protein
MHNEFLVIVEMVPANPLKCSGGRARRAEAARAFRKRDASLVGVDFSEGLKKAGIT